MYACEVFTLEESYGTEMDHAVAGVLLCLTVVVAVLAWMLAVSTASKRAFWVPPSSLWRFAEHGVPSD